MFLRSNIDLKCNGRKKYKKRFNIYLVIRIIITRYYYILLFYTRYLLVYKYLAVVVQAVEDKKAHIGIFEFGFLKTNSTTCIKCRNSIIIIQNIIIDYCHIILLQTHR